MSRLRLHRRRLIGPDLFVLMTMMEHVRRRRRFLVGRLLLKLMVGVVPNGSSQERES